VLSRARNRLGAATRISYPWLRDPGQLGRNNNMPMLPYVKLILVFDFIYRSQVYSVGPGIVIGPDV
jgi:hypothetical protein